MRRSRKQGTTAANSRTAATRVLVIEKQSSGNRSLADYLAQNGYSVASLPGDFSLLSAVQPGFHPEFILINDASLPPGDGLEYLSSLAALYSVPTILYGTESGRPSQVKKLVIGNFPGPGSGVTDPLILDRLEEIIRGYPRYCSAPAAD